MPFLAPGVLLKSHPEGQRDKGRWFTGVPGPSGHHWPQWGWPGFLVPPGGPGRHQKTVGAHRVPVLALLRFQIKVNE